MSMSMSTSTSAPCLFPDLPVPVRIVIFNYLGQTQDELINLTLVSKQFCRDCKRPGIEWKIIRTYEITPRLKSTTSGLLHKLVYNKLNNSEKFSRYQHVKINRINEFDKISSEEAELIYAGFCNRRGKSLSLDFSLPPDEANCNKRTAERSVITSVLRCLFQNNEDEPVQEINLSNIMFQPEKVNESIFQLFCQSTKKIIWNHSKDNVHLFGNEFKSTQEDLKEIIMDDTDFLVHSQVQSELISDLIERPNQFYIFEGCTSLERLSIKNAKCSSIADSSLSQRVDIPQNVLIKYARNAPTTLNWFRSDLTKDNIDMLKKERPEIEFL
jgi:hypothetical protein